VGLDDGPQAAEEFFGLPPAVVVGDPGGGHAEILAGVGDVGPGELPKPFQVPVDRLQRGTASLAVLAEMVLVRRCGHGGAVLSLRRCGQPARPKTYSYRRSRSLMTIPECRESGS